MDCEAQLCYELRVSYKTQEEKINLDRSQIDIGRENRGLHSMKSAISTAVSRGDGLP